MLGVATARLDKALDRGQCGMWDWDIAKGMIFWSRSMFDILGMPVKGDFLSFARGGRAGSTRNDTQLEDGRRKPAGRRDHRPSTRNSACATRTATGSGSGPVLRLQRATRPDEPHLIGIVFDITQQKQDRQAQQGGRASADGCGRKHLGGLRAVGCRQPPGAVQFQVPAVPFAARLGLRARHALRGRGAHRQGTRRSASASA